MKTMAAAKAKLNFGELLDSAQREPVRITKKDRAVAVVMSEEEYARLQALEDSIWAARAKKVMDSEEPLSPEETLDALKVFLNAEA